MAIADNKALLLEIMNVVDDHVTAKASRQLEQQIMDILDGYQIATMIRDDAADAIDKLVKICNSILSKYEEEAEAVIWEYSLNIDEDIDELRKEIEDYKAQINSVVEPMEKEHTDV